MRTSSNNSIRGFLVLSLFFIYVVYDSGFGMLIRSLVRNVLNFNYNFTTQNMLNAVVLVLIIYHYVSLERSSK